MAALFLYNGIFSILAPAASPLKALADAGKGRLGREASQVK